MKSNWGMATFQKYTVTIYVWTKSDSCKYWLHARLVPSSKAGISPKGICGVMSGQS